MWNKLRKNTIVRHTIGVVILVLVAYFVIAPAYVHATYPQYQIIKKYPDVQVCTDLPPGTPSAVFLPISCETLNNSHLIGCVYNSPHYSAPAQPTSDEKILCPLLVVGHDITGVSNSALPALAISENTLQIIVAAPLVGLVIIMYSAIRLIIRPSKPQGPTDYVRSDADEHESRWLP